MVIKKSVELILWESLQEKQSIYKASKKAGVDWHTAKSYYDKFENAIQIESEKLQTSIPDEIEKKGISFLNIFNPRSG